MGQTELFSENAEKLGVDLSLVDSAVLSHGHYDHGGGLRKFLTFNSKAAVYLSKYAFEPHYNGTSKYIGLDTTLHDHSRLIYTDDTENIDSGITLFSCAGYEKKHELGSFGLTEMHDGEFRPDDFRHEQYLLIEENGKRILFSGCSHKGVLDIAQWFRPDVMIGGFHFSKLPLDGTLEEYARFLDGFDTDYYTCHCTGIEQYAFMKKYMSRLNYITCGQTVAI